jgi:hypothetical protein
MSTTDILATYGATLATAVAACNGFVRWRSTKPHRSNDCICAVSCPQQISRLIDFGSPSMVSAPLRYQKG